MCQFVKNLACEWGHQGIRANAVCPWYIATELANQVLADEGYSRKVVSATPMQRVGQPEEVAGRDIMLHGTDINHPCYRPGGYSLHIAEQPDLSVSRTHVPKPTDTVPSFSEQMSSRTRGDLDVWAG